MGSKKAVPGGPPENGHFVGPIFWPTSRTHFSDVFGRVLRTRFFGGGIYPHLSGVFDSSWNFRNFAIFIFAINQLLKTGVKNTVSGGPPENGHFVHPYFRPVFPHLTLGRRKLLFGAGDFSRSRFLDRVTCTTWVERVFCFRVDSRDFLLVCELLGPLHAFFWPECSFCV